MSSLPLEYGWTSAHERLSVLTSREEAPKLQMYMSESSLPVSVTALPTSLMGTSKEGMFWSHHRMWVGSNAKSHLSAIWLTEEECQSCSIVVCIVLICSKRQHVRFLVSVWHRFTLIHSYISNKTQPYVTEERLVLQGLPNGESSLKLGGHRTNYKYNCWIIKLLWWICIHYESCFRLSEEGASNIHSSRCPFWAPRTTKVKIYSFGPFLGTLEIPEGKLGLCSQPKMIHSELRRSYDLSGRGRLPRHPPAHLVWMCS